MKTEFEDAARQRRAHGSSEINQTASDLSTAWEPPASVGLVVERRPYHDGVACHSTGIRRRTGAEARRDAQWYSRRTAFAPRRSRAPRGVARSARRDIGLLPWRFPQPLSTSDAGFAGLGAPFGVSPMSDPRKRRARSHGQPFVRTSSSCATG